MATNGSSQPSTYLIFLAIIGWVIYRRTRPQQVRRTQTIIYTAAIVVLSLAGLGANAGMLSNPLFLGLAPVMLVLGFATGWQMMRTIRFWRDETTDQVWISGGVLYVAIWLAIYAIRLGTEYLATGSFFPSGPAAAAQAPSDLAIIASDLLVFSVGLWLARGYALVRRYQEHSIPTP